MTINDRDIEELLRIRRKVSQAVWDYINNVICNTINARTYSDLTDAEVDSIRNHLKSNLLQ